MSDKTIFKYALNRYVDITDLDLHIGAEILTVGIQGEDIVFWALVDMHEKATERRSFAIVGTGWALPADQYLAKNYLGKVEEAPFVWHIFEVTK